MKNQLPESFIDKVLELYPTQADSVLKTFSERPSYSIRVNSIKTTTEEVKKELAAQGIQTEPIPWNPYGLIVPALRQADPLIEHPLYSSGWFSIQNLSSMIPPLILNPQPNENILDLAAAPGSKTGMIAELMKNTGTIIANDISKARIYKLQATLSRLGVTNTQIRSKPGERIWEDYPDYFDRVLVDAPCSMEGMFNLQDPESYEHWSPKKVKRLAKQQRWLLRSAVSATKPGGIIVYSTCTLSPEENEGVVQWFLERYGSTASLLNTSLTFTPGLTKWQNKTYFPELERTQRVLPDGVMEGFFVATFRKSTD